MQTAEHTAHIYDGAREEGNTGHPTVTPPPGIHPYTYVTPAGLPAPVTIRIHSSECMSFPRLRYKDTPASLECTIWDHWALEHQLLS